jgi:hypothetical protein
MRRTHLVASAFIVAVLTAGSARIVAQQSAAAVLFTPVSGTVDSGLTFNGTFMIQRFEARNNGAVAFGSVTGLMTPANGIARNVVTQVAIPIAISPGTGSLATTPGVVPTTCGGVHLDLARSTFRVLGSTVTLDPSALDLTAAQAATATTVTQTTGFGLATGLSSIPVSASDLLTTAGGAAASSTIGANTNVPPTTTVTGPLGQPVTVPSTLTSIGTFSPGVATPAQSTPATPVGSSPQFEQLVCSAGALSQSGSAGPQVVQLLNQMLATMGG